MSFGWWLEGPTICGVGGRSAGSRRVGYPCSFDSNLKQGLDDVKASIARVRTITLTELQCLEDSMQGVGISMIFRLLSSASINVTQVNEFDRICPMGVSM